MLMSRHKWSFGRGAILAIVAALPTAGAQSAFYWADIVAQGEIKQEGDWSDPAPPTTEEFGFFESDDGAGPVSVSADETIHALWNGTGTASAGAGTLRVGLTSVVGDNLPDRWVSSLFATATAGATDSVQVVGAGGLAYVDYSFRVDGTLSGPGSYVQIIGVDPIFGNGAYQDKTFFGGTEAISVDEDFTFRVEVFQGMTHFNVSLFSQIYYQPPESDYKVVAPDYQVATIDFTNTARLTGVTGRNAAGERVALTSVIGQSGDDYLALADPGAAVPEPATWAMMIAGFGLIGGAARRRRQLAVAFS